MESLKLCPRDPRGLVLLLLSLLLLLLSAGCIDQQYVKADRLTYTRVEPRARQAIMADKTLTPDERQSELDNLATWELRIREAEKK